MIHLSILILLAVSVLPAQSARGVKVPRCADISIAGIYLADRESTERVLGREITLIDSLDLPEARFYNRDKSEVLSLIFHPGGVRNEFCEFRVTYANDLSGGGKGQETQLSHFVSGKGIRLGLEERKLRELLGSNCKRGIKGDSIVLRYRLDDFHNSQFLKTYNMPVYYGKYRFRNGKLVEFAFGFEYP